jgi:hypothetical protein
MICDNSEPFLEQGVLHSSQIKKYSNDGKDSEFVQNALETIRKLSETCSHLEGFIIYNNLTDDLLSPINDQIMREVYHNFPKNLKFGIGIKKSG